MTFLAGAKEIISQFCDTPDRIMKLLHCLVMNLMDLIPSKAIIISRHYA